MFPRLSMNNSLFILSKFNIDILSAECDECYELVETEVNLLRQMQTNLTTYVVQLEAQDNNTVLGPFHQRLDQTQQNMQTLLAFVGILWYMLCTAKMTKCYSATQ